MAIIIGIDPGSRMTGYGILQQTGDKLTYIDSAPFVQIPKRCLNA